MGGAASVERASDLETFRRLRGEFAAGGPAPEPGSQLEDTEFRLFQEYVEGVRAAHECKDLTDFSFSFSFASSASTVALGEDASQAASEPTEAVGAYDVQDVVGRGAFAVVKLARLKADPNAPLVVLKQLNVPMAELSDRERAATETEVAVLKKLQHPNVIRFIDAFQAGGVLNIVMEYANAGSLDEKLKACGDHALSEPEVWAALVQLLEGLAYVHSQSVLHRDIKPMNVMLSGEEGHTLKLCDFGISKVLQEEDGGLAKTVVGTPYYLSPELCEGKAYDGRSDTWALGCVLYELMARRKAFTARGIPGLVMAIMGGNREPLPEGYSGELKALCDEMLALTAEERPQISDLLQRPIVQEKLAQLRDSSLLEQVAPHAPSREEVLPTAVEPELGRDWYHNARVFQWGSGQTRPRLMEMLLEADVQALVCGRQHYLTICGNGDLYAWGVAEEGQLGLGHPAHDQRRPVVVQAFASRGSRITAVAAGGSHSLALDSRGDVWVWGAVAPLEADDLRLTRGERKENWPDWAQEEPPRENPSENPFSVKRGSSGKSGGGGGNPFASPPKKPKSPRPPPVQLREGSCFKPHLIAALCLVKVTQVSAGEGFSAALVDDGRVLTWGRGGEGRLGLGHEDDVRAPAHVSALDPVDPVVEVRCGDSHVVVRTQSHKALAWGGNDAAQCGNGVSDDDTPLLLPTPVAGLDSLDLSAVHAGPTSSAAVTTDGLLYLWGRGHGTAALWTTGADDQKRVALVELALYHTMVATEDGVLYSFSPSSPSQLEDPSLLGAAPGTGVVTTLLNRNFRGLAANGERSFALVAPHE